MPGVRVLLITWIPRLPSSAHLPGKVSHVCMPPPPFSRELRVRYKGFLSPLSHHDPVKLVG